MPNLPTDAAKQGKQHLSHWMDLEYMTTSVWIHWLVIDACSGWTLHTIEVITGR